ncbi:MAG: hypothetical protein ACI8UD_001611 [Planctomycetota bacterium]|jgi:hypothetical protein
MIDDDYDAQQDREQIEVRLSCSPNATSVAAARHLMLAKD